MSPGDASVRTAFLTRRIDVIGNARLAGLERDLGLQGYDYNVILTTFYLSYILFEIPSNIICKTIGPGWFIPAITVCFGATSIATAFVETMAQAAGVRFVLGEYLSLHLPPEKD